MPLHAAVLLLSALGPLAALAPRGMPVWLLSFAAVALWSLARDRARPGAGFSAWAATTLRVDDRPAAAAAAALIVWAGVSTMWSPSGRAGLTALELAYVAVCGFVVHRRLTTLSAGDRRRLLRVAAWSTAAGIALYGVENAFGYPLYQLWHGDKSLEWLVASNVPKRAAALLALLLWPAAAAAGGVRNAAIGAGTLASTLLTSRSAAAGLGVGAAAYALASIGRAGVVRRLLQTGALLAFVAAVPAGLYLSRASADLPTDGWSRSLLHRMEIWGHAATRALDFPLRGQGVDASRSLPIRDEVSRFEPLVNSALPLHPHNAFLQVWLELGAVGAALAAFILWRAPTYARTPVALGYAATALTLASSAYGLWQAWWMSGIVVAGLLTALAQSDETQSDGAQSDETQNDGAQSKTEKRP